MLDKWKRVLVGNRSLSGIRLVDAMIFVQLNGSNRGMSEGTENALARLSLTLNALELADHQ